MAAEWRTDPTGRHQLRWWDGNDWTDHVADNGATSTDPYQAPPPVVSVPNVPPPTPVAPPAPSPAPVAPTPQPAYLSGGSVPSTPVTSAPRKKVPVAIIGGVVAVVALIVVLVFVVGGGGGGSDSSTVRGEIRGDDALGLRFSAEVGEVIIVSVEPLGDDDDVEFRSGILFTEDTLRDHYEAFLFFEEEVERSESYYEDFDDFEDDYSQNRSFEDYQLGNLDDEFGDGYFLSGPRETEFPGPDSFWEVIDVSGDYAVVVLPFDGSGEVEIEIQRCPGSIDLSDYYRARAENDEPFDLIEDACEDIDVPLGS